MNLKFLLVLTFLVIIQKTSFVLAQDLEETDEDLIDKFEKDQEQTSSQEKPNSDTDQNTNPNSNLEEAPVPLLPVNVPQPKPSTEPNTSSNKGVVDQVDLVSLNENVPPDSSNPCSCVKYFLCDIENGAVIDNGEGVIGLIDIRLGGSTKGSPCNHYFDICCKQMKEPTDVVPDPVSQHSICGKRNIGGVGFRITGALDGEAQFGEIPLDGCHCSPRTTGRQTCSQYFPLWGFPNSSQSSSDRCSLCFWEKPDRIESPFRGMGHSDT